MSLLNQLSDCWRVAFAGEKLANNLFHCFWNVSPVLGYFGKHWDYRHNDTLLSLLRGQLSFKQQIAT